mmetsp:Transcript_123899/g.174758  ORF Transcript_123899/g.174758 Transcript_123899/m.174758 type:complete len:108 (+) Transcript_123899:324-647(+)
MAAAAIAVAKPTGSACSAFSCDSGMSGALQEGKDFRFGSDGAVGSPGVQLASGGVGTKLEDGTSWKSSTGPSPGPQRGSSGLRSIGRMGSGTFIGTSTTWPCGDGGD